jgi:DNA-cytosine methyltransferase
LNILSTFDGISCGQVALERAGIKVENYYASEIDKSAIKITQKNYPNTIQIGDVTKVKGSDLPKIDLLIGGSPCQGFSMAGKQLNFDDPRSALFFEYVRLLNEVKPKYFLLENVKMKKEYEDIITQHLGVKPIEINSALVSAQNRVRLYWTNILGIQQPKDKGILLKDIIIDGEVDRDKSFCIDGNYYKGGNIKQYFEKHRRQIVFTQKFGEDSQSLNRVLKSTKAFDGKGNCMTATMYKGMASNGATNIIQNYKFRMLYPIECERLQNLPDNYTAIGVIDGKEVPISNTQRYKMLGNGWTVDVIAHILSFIQ